MRLEPFLFPVYGWPLVHRVFYGAGLVLYDLLGAARDGGRAHHLDAEAVARARSAHPPAGLRGGITYHDGVEDDARLALAVARTAIEHGGVAVTRVRATELLGGTAARRPSGVEGVVGQDLVRGERARGPRPTRHRCHRGLAGPPRHALGEVGLQLVPSRGSAPLVRARRDCRSRRA